MNSTLEKRDHGGVSRPCGPDRQPQDGKYDSPVPYVSQAPQAVRSAGSRRWDRVLPACARAGRTLQADKRDAFGLTVQVHWLRNISSTAATRAVVRSHSLSPLSIEGILHEASAKFTADSFALRITNKILRSPRANCQELQSPQRGTKPPCRNWRRGKL